MLSWDRSIPEEVFNVIPALEKFVILLRKEMGKALDNQMSWYFDIQLRNWYL